MGNTTFRQPGAQPEERHAFVQGPNVESFGDLSNAPRDCQLGGFTIKSAEREQPPQASPALLAFRALHDAAVQRQQQFAEEIICEQSGTVVMSEPLLAQPEAGDDVIPGSEEYYRRYPHLDPCF